MLETPQGLPRARSAAETATSQGASPPASLHSGRMRPSRCTRCLAQHHCRMTPSITPRARTPSGSLQLHHHGTVEVTTPGGDQRWDPGTLGEKILAMLPAPSPALRDVPHPGVAHGGMSSTPPSETAASSYLLPHSGRAAGGLHGGLRLALGTPRPPTASHSSIWWKRRTPAMAHQAPLPRHG